MNRSFTEINTSEHCLFRVRVRPIHGGGLEDGEVEPLLLCQTLAHIIFSPQVVDIAPLLTIIIFANSIKMSLQFLTSFPEMWREGVPHLFLGSWRRFYFVTARSLLPFDGRSILYNLYNESVYTLSL